MKAMSTLGRIFIALAPILLIVAVIMLVFSGYGTQLDWWHFRTGFSILRYGAYLGIASALLAIVTIFILLLWHRRCNLITVNVLIAIVGIIVAAIPYSWQQQAANVPPIHDISTDLDNPPEYVAIAPLREDAPNPVDYAGKETASAQRKAYPYIQPMYFDSDPEYVFSAAQQVITELGWEQVSANKARGRIEATDTTRWFGFKDDVVIRIQRHNGQTRLDIRSKSRVGKSDVGTNAARIRTFMEVMRLKLSTAS